MIPDSLFLLLKVPFSPFSEPLFLLFRVPFSFSSKSRRQGNDRHGYTESDHVHRWRATDRMTAKERTKAHGHGESQ